MSVGITAGHTLLRLLVAPGRQRFERNLNSLEAVQRARLSRWLRHAAHTPQGTRRGIRADWTWEEFSKQLPLSSYQDHAAIIAEQQLGKQAQLIDSPVMRYQPTSGSTSAVKWIPYTKLFLDELDQTITAWVGDLYRQFPHQARGTHYWSLSWIPSEMRGQTAGDINDDMKMLSFGKRALAYLTQAVPQEVALAQSSDDSLFATIAYLAANHELSFMSVWSPTFGLGILERMGHWRAELAEALSQGNWGNRVASMAGVACPRSPRAAALLRSWDGEPCPDFFQALWPALAVVSAWDTAAATPWAHKLRGLLPHASFQGKGLWATEGVVTFPFDGRYPLAYLSHFYEFIDANDGKLMASWQLRDGQDVIPVITTGSGFARYQMSDVLRVDGHLGQVPCLTFLGRNDGVDLVGEKTSSSAALALQQSLPLKHGALPVTLLALDEARGKVPGYVLLVECHEPEHQASVEIELAEHVERVMLASFHYKLARELGQLQPAACVAKPDMRQFYMNQCKERGMIEGNIKVEPLRHWRGQAPAVLRDALDA